MRLLEIHLWFEGGYLPSCFYTCRGGFLDSKTTTRFHTPGFSVQHKTKVLLPVLLPRLILS